MSYSCSDFFDDIIAVLDIDTNEDGVEEQKDLCVAEIERLQHCEQHMLSGLVIPWANKADYSRHKVALDAQDAVNLRALAREFVKIVDQAAEETQSTEATWADPAVRLFINKFESLSHSNWNNNFSEAYKACQEKAG